MAIYMRHSASAYLVIFALAQVFVGAASAGQGMLKPGRLAREQVEFFEKFIRPVLAERCYACHSTQARKVKGRLLLDSQAGIAKGGESGPVLVPGNVEKSLLIQAIRWTNADLAMPPKAKLSPQQIERFEQWVKMGAPDPRTEAALGTAKKGTAPDLESGRKWWAFLPVSAMAAPVVKQQGWARKK